MRRSLAALLVLAALIIGAALLMRVDTPWQILGYPGLAILCFLAAVIFAIGLLYSISAEDRKSRKNRPRSSEIFKKFAAMLSRLAGIGPAQQKQELRLGLPLQGFTARHHAFHFNHRIQPVLAYLRLHPRFGWPVEPDLHIL